MFQLYCSFWSNCIVQKGRNTENKNRIKISCEYANADNYVLHSYKVSRNSIELLRGFRGVALTNYFSGIFHFGQIYKFKKGVSSRKIMEAKFLWICTSTWYVLHNYKVSLTSVEQFQRSCQVWLKLTQWFWRRFLNFVNVFSLFHNHLPLEKGGGTSFEQTWILITQGCSVPSLI